MLIGEDTRWDNKPRHKVYMITPNIILANVAEEALTDDKTLEVS